MSKRARWVLMAVLVVGLAGAVLNTLWAAGTFRRLEPHGPGACVRIEGIVGGEDLVWRGNGREILVSSTDRWNPNVAQGGIFLVEPGAEDLRPRQVTPELDFVFQPHGISLWVEENTGQERLFVVNHASLTEHSIEVFDVAADGQLAHVRTIVDEALISPNDVAAVGPEQFYVTNDHGWRSTVAKVFEDFLRLPLGNVVYYDGSGFREVFGGTRIANGVNVSLDGARVYVTETTGRVLHSFARDAKTGALTLEETFFAGTGLDNIDVAPDGSLWVGAHPKLLQFLAHAANPQKRAPSQVLRFVHGADGRLAMEEVYLDGGETISASATALARDGMLVIGPVFEAFLLRCDL